MHCILCFLLQWNPSIAATVGEWHFGCYMEVAVVEGFQVLRFLVHEQLLFVQRHLHFKYVCKPHPQLNVHNAHKVHNSVKLALRVKERERTRYAYGSL